MTTIDVDFEVFKHLTAKRRSEAMTENDVIRELLNLPVAGRVSSTTAAGGTPWVTKGVTFPEGTEFRTQYKGREYKGVVRNGALVLNGQRYTSPSAAAYSVTNCGVNGWRFWECLLPGSKHWVLIAQLRR